MLLRARFTLIVAIKMHNNGKQFIYPVLQPHLKKLQTRKQPRKNLEFLGNAIVGDRCYLCVSVLPQCG